MTGLVILVTVLVLAAAALAAPAWLRKRRSELTRTVYESEHGLLYEDGRYVGPAAPGRYWLVGLRERLVVTLPRAPRQEPVANVDVTAADALSFRLSATLVYEVVEPRAAHEGAYREALRLALTDALVRLAADKTLEALLASRAGLGAAALALLPETVCGCAPRSVVVTAVSLPPETRRLFAEVERARREGQAALERARGEHAALRSLANAARMLKGNPELMNLRLLQALSAAGGRGTLVLGRDALDPTLKGAPETPEPEEAA
jgi:regulator of protease activity HflC (stomatin/prohibitin superfamily)